MLTVLSISLLQIPFHFSAHSAVPGSSSFQVGAVMSSKGVEREAVSTVVKSMDSGIRYLRLEPLPLTGFVSLVIIP